MNMKKRISSTILATFICGSMFAGTFIAGNGVSHSTDDLRKLVFSNGKVETYFNDGSMTTYDFSSLQRIYFTDIVGNEDPTIVDDVADGALLLYPNPASDYINLKGVPADANITVFNISGMVISNMLADGDVLSIDVANYKSGVYFIKINSDVVKFVKK